MKAAKGDFEFPKIYYNNKDKLKKLIAKGKQELLEFSHWSTADDFMHFILKKQFLEFVDATYPTPRVKTEVPVWFLVCTQLLLRIYSNGNYNELDTLLRSGSILSRVGFNVSREIGFNAKNKHERKTACHQDTVRKFFKDSKVSQMRKWFCVDLQKWFLRNNAINTEGVFILDQTHIVVPDNKSYSDAVYMPVDEHGQFYKGTKEQIAAYKWHPCYTLSTLLNVNRSKNSFHYAGYKFGPGNEDEFPQAEAIVKDYIDSCGKGVIKLLICDRGYISGDFINFCKLENDIDVLLPLKKNMALYVDAVNLAKQTVTDWDIISDPEEENARERGEDFTIRAAATLRQPKLWEECNVSLYVTVVKTEKGNNFAVEQEDFFVLCSTKNFSSPVKGYQHYCLRSRVEECFRQIKHVWQLKKFTSPHRSLMEAHIGFILLTYSLLNLYLRQTKKQDLVGQFLSTIKKEAKATDADKTIVAYADNVFGLFSIKEYMQLICQLNDEEREKFMECLNAVNQR